MNRLKELRESKDLLAKDVADYLNIDEEKYNEYEASKEKIPIFDTSRPQYKVEPCFFLYFYLRSFS